MLRQSPLIRHGHPQPIKNQPSGNPGKNCVGLMLHLKSFLRLRSEWHTVKVQLLFDLRDPGNE